MTVGRATAPRPERAASNRPPGAERAAVLYDRDCGFCRWSLARLLKLDRRLRLRPVALQDPEADDLLRGMEAERRFASAHLVTTDGEVYSGGAAIALSSASSRGVRHSRPRRGSSRVC